MDIKEAIQTLKEYCSSIDDCTDCKLYLQDEYYEMYCYLDNKVPEEYEIDKVEYEIEKWI